LVKPAEIHSNKLEPGISCRCCGMLTLMALS